MLVVLGFSRIDTQHTAGIFIHVARRIAVKLMRTPLAAKPRMSSVSQDYHKLAGLPKELSDSTRYFDVGDESYMHRSA